MNRTSGRVGIGTTTPAYKLDVDGTGRFKTNSGSDALRLFDTRSDYNVNIRFDANDSGGTTRTGFLAWTPQTGTDQSRLGVGNGSFEIFSVRMDGNVGIGTTSPAYPLDVNGVLRANWTYLANRNNDGTFWDIKENSGNGNFQIETNGSTPKMTVTPAGTIGMGDIDSTARLTVKGTSGSKYSMANFTDGAVGEITFGTGCWRPSITFFENYTNNWTIGVDGSCGPTANPPFKISASDAIGTHDVLTITNSGYVGIGTTGPSWLLDVRGNSNAPTGSGGGPAVLQLGGPTAGTNASIKMGFVGGSRAWIQSYAYPLYINELGNDVIINRDAGNVGIRTENPTAPLHVQGVAFFNATSSVAGNVTIAGDGGNIEIMRVNDGSGFSGFIDFKNTSTSDYDFRQILRGKSLIMATQGGGGVVMGSGYSNNQPPANGLLVEGNVGINKTNPSTALDVSGTITGTTKNFEIDHPTKHGYRLVHSTLEGPEIAVFYRGTGRLVNGTARIRLPEYFDKLTRDKTYTVLLTAKGTTPFLLSYDNFNEKSFVVYGTVPSGDFDWEVKATRADVAPLVVEKPDTLN